jgi:hypothetical protein
MTTALTFAAEFAVAYAALWAAGELFDVVLRR